LEEEKGKAFITTLGEGPVFLSRAVKKEGKICGKKKELKKKKH